MGGLKRFACAVAFARGFRDMLWRMLFTHYMRHRVAMFSLLLFAAAATPLRATTMQIRLLRILIDMKVTPALTKMSSRCLFLLRDFIFAAIFLSTTKCHCHTLLYLFLSTTGRVLTKYARRLIKASISAYASSIFQSALLRHRCHRRCHLVDIYRIIASEFRFSGISDSIIY